MKEAAVEARQVVDPGPSARGQPRSRRYAVWMPQMLPRHVGARGTHVAPGQRLDEVAAAPLEDHASGQVDTAGRFGFRVSDERYQAALGSEARDDVHMIREDRHLVDVYLPARCCFTNCCSHDVGVSEPERTLS